MCTASWHQTESGFNLIFNRDEQRTRSPALPPALRKTDTGEPYVSPQDPDGGGSWIAGNAHGLCVALLNSYERPTEVISPTRSRGQLVTALMQATTIEAATLLVKDLLAADSVAPCLLLLQQPRSAVSLIQHPGGSPRPREPELGIVTTSSFLPDSVQEWRRRKFRETVHTPEDLPAFHDLACPEDPAYGVRMEREDARTVSQTRLQVSGTTVRMHYRELPDGPWSMIAIPPRSS